MPETHPQNGKTHLTLALAQGIRAAKWARDNQVPKNTAFRWAKDPKICKAVEACRRRTIDHAVGRMTRHATWAADAIVAIAKQAESVRLRAAGPCLRT